MLFKVKLPNSSRSQCVWAREILCQK